MFSSPLLLALLLPVLFAAYVLSTFLLLLLRQARSPLRHLPGPPSPSFFMGNLREMHDQENNDLVARWEAQYGRTFVYRGFVGGCRLMTTDPVAVAHILGRAYDYPKPDFVRDSLASMAAGHEGLLTVEGDDHRRQRKILTPAFSHSHIKSLSPVFWEKASQLRDIWLDIIARSDSIKADDRAPSDPLSPALSPLPLSNSAAIATGSDFSGLRSRANVKEKDRRNETEVVALGEHRPYANRTGQINARAGAIPTPFLPLPNPFAAFTPSKAVPSSPSPLAAEPARGKHEVDRDGEVEANAERGAKVDVLAWLARATLDVIGQAGFGYTFNSLRAGATQLHPDADGGGDSMASGNELARAFGIIFSTARQFRVMTILQVWFPVLRRFRPNSATMKEAHATMRRIGLELIEERRAVLSEGSTSSSKTPSSFPHDKENGHVNRNGVVDSAIEGDKTTLGRDLLSVLIRSNLASDPSQRLSVNEILCQISTFLAAGHETTSSALTWTLYALARAPRVQHKLRAHLRALHISSTPPSPCSPCSPLSTIPTSASPSPSPYPTPSDLTALLTLPYLDHVLRESLRLHAPITSTMRVASHSDAIPLSAPYTDRWGRTCGVIEVKKGDIVSVPIQAVNKGAGEWGEDAGVFRPERWEEEPAGEERRGKGVQGLWGNMLTFLNGNPMNGNRACIGYRFALNEIKIFLFVLLRDIEFSIDPSIEIEKKVNVVTRPCVKGQEHLGNQMPLYMRRVPPEEGVPVSPISPASPISPSTSNGSPPCEFSARQYQHPSASAV